MATEKEITYFWNDEPEGIFHSTVVVGSEWTEGEEDSNIFFYFSSESELEKAKTGKDYEFTILEVKD